MKISYCNDCKKYLTIDFFRINTGLTNKNIFLNRCTNCIHQINNTNDIIFTSEGYVTKNEYVNGVELIDRYFK